MLDMFKRNFFSIERNSGIQSELKNAKTKNTSLYNASDKNITLFNMYNEIQNNEISSLNKKEKIGKTRHYPPATKEWVNSTYSYNKNNTKTLAVADNIVNKLIRSYLNMNPLINKKRSKRVEIRFKRLSLNKVIVSKAEMKHSNNKVIVTIYLYNRNKKFFLYKLKNLYKDKASNVSLKGLNNAKNIMSETNSNVLPLKDSNLKRKIKFISLRAIKLVNKVRKHQDLLIKTLYWDNSNFLHYKNKYYKKFIKDAYEIELLYMYYIKMLSLNNNKFKNWFLLGLRKTISKLYNKKVEFNFVSLKYLHLNSDIFIESIVTRIRNRDNPLLLVLTKALRLAKVPSRNHNLNNSALKDKISGVNSFNKNQFFPFITSISKGVNSGTEVLLEKNLLNAPLTKSYANDVLHTLINKLFSCGEAVKSKETFSLLKAKKLNNKQISVLDSIKYKTVLGVRLEAAGRLSKRLTASRSVFKLRYKGGLKNIYSSKRGVSSVILRGNANSNVQYTLINNKTRNGSFGLKGWINGY